MEVSATMLMASASVHMDMTCLTASAKHVPLTSAWLVLEVSDVTAIPELVCARMATMEPLVRTSIVQNHV